MPSIQLLIQYQITTLI